MFKRQIARGVELLNRERPGWLQKIDLDTLNMENPLCCVLGQVDGGYWKSSLQDFDGFNLSWDEATGVQAIAKWDKLTEEWKEKIIELRGKG